MTDQAKSAVELAAEFKQQQAQALDKVREVAENAIAKADRGEALTKSAKEVADEALLKMGDLTAQFASLEQKLARGDMGQPEVAKTYGEMLTESDDFKAFKDGGFARGGKASLHLKTALTTLATNAPGSVGATIRNTRLPDLLELAQRRLTVRDLLSPGRMDGNTLEYGRETGFRNNAATVAETALKPESDFQTDMVTTSAKVIAHWFKPSRQALDDVAGLRSMIDQRLMFGLKDQEERQLLNGDGTGQNLSGLVTNATAYAAPITVTGETSIDRLRLAILQTSVAQYPATGIVLNELDWAHVEMMKDGDGRYLIGNPIGNIGATLWGLPVVSTSAIAVDKFLVGAFRMGAQLFDRWDARIEVGYVNDDFIRNFVTILGEERLALAIYRPQAFVYGDFGRVA